MENNKKIILGVTGSIAAYKSADLVRRLQEKNFDVSVIMTKEAENFITALTLSTLSGQKVYQNMFQQDENAWEMAHIQLAEQADLLLIAPATANIIGKVANGLADDLLTCTVISTRAPIVFVPAMNDEMYNNKMVQQNCRKLKDAGYFLIEPVKGKLACGTTGVGHIAEIDDIVKTVIELTNKK